MVCLWLFFVEFAYSVLNYCRFTSKTQPNSQKNFQKSKQLQLKYCKHRPLVIRQNASMNYLSWIHLIGEYVDEGIACFTDSL